MSPPPAASSASAMLESTQAMRLPRLPDSLRLDPWEMLKRALAAFAEAQSTINRLRDRVDYLESLSVTDELTGLFNRRGFERELERALALARRHDKGGVLVFIDLDEFKRVNDELGHAAGDVLLLTAARVLRTSVRQTDVVARISGDEFACLLTPVAAEEGMAKAGRLQAALNLATAPFAGCQIPLRASLGATPFGAASEASTLLREADLVMYADKRNRKAARGLRTPLTPGAVGRRD